MTDHPFFVSQYGGLEWVALGFTLTAFYLVGNKSRVGFGIFLCSNALWFSIAWYADVHAMMVSFSCVFAINLRNFIKWRPPKEQK